MPCNPKSKMALEPRHRLASNRMRLRINRTRSWPTESAGRLALICGFPLHAPKRHPTRDDEAPTMKSICMAPLLICSVLAAPTVSPAQDSPKDKQAPTEKKPIAPKAFLKSLVGSWEGTCQTWFQPGKLADESKVKGKIVPLLGGRFYRHEYEGSMQGKPRHGEETIAWNAIMKRFQISWIDDFHMSDGIMFSEGAATAAWFRGDRKIQRRPEHSALGLENRLRAHRRRSPDDHRLQRPTKRPGGKGRRNKIHSHERVDNPRNVLNSPHQDSEAGSPHRPSSLPAQDSRYDWSPPVPAAHPSRTGPPE